jgi:hypothetical protein
MSVDSRGDGKYVYRKSLARYMTQRHDEIRDMPAEERSEDEHLLLYLMKQINDMQRQLKVFIERREGPQSTDMLIVDAYAELVERHQGVMNALRANGYRGKALAAEVSGWLMRQREM